ncbi:BTB/POZ domain-containing adapter for CUL3-mediated RhoA degradation protein 2 isoform X1 [Oreochromis niloticus]|uniref:BTB/POZ domain-containing adapter for CUL3-mediated RhoA degradation protein 2 isoform X1 n=1 Tax=Oreochromis niloticus TaxID=8128 RepID=UPI000673F672|nr:BTB/POZ domain-containing adapter for CUL3-mediated RhoA degradation protein 2 isoform X1 [Oreochromis niloticus]XP_025754018.1 BTB/POZ domain-containing adapter for CUL3-mediated RhoA degradation protein 2 isoform X1 [Oreochromis niloticus]
MSGDSCLPQDLSKSETASPDLPLACPKTKTCSHRGAVGLGNKYVRLNVGGMLFYTTLQVLTRQNSMLKAMFSGKKEVFTDKDGWILIDRSGKHFGSILCYLRDGRVALPKGRQAVQELLVEAKHFLVQGLVELCQNSLQGNKEQPMCVIPVVTSIKEEEKLIQSSSKPVVKLVYNRSNNKYSYTSNSDDHLLKNIELFDRLSLSFNGRILFIKDVIGDEICCWSFYGQGRKLSEVCCTSIVYATEKKQTKVEFPEARIYEETLNTLLYETMPLPDNSLLEATRRRYNNCGSHSEEEEGPGGPELRERVRRIHVKSLRGPSDGLSETARDCRCSLLIHTLHIIRIQSSSFKHRRPAAFSFLIKCTV